MSTENINATTPIKRLMEFVEWAIENELCSSYSDFERKSSLAPRYIMNNNSMGKGNIGTEMLGRIVRAFPQLNLVWLCTGDGSMTVTAPAPAPAQPTRIDLNEDYKKAYEGAMMQVMALNRILKKLDSRK